MFNVDKLVMQDNQRLSNGQLVPMNSYFWMASNKNKYFLNSLDLFMKEET